MVESLNNLIIKSDDLTNKSTPCQDVARANGGKKTTV
jgi:hypothetical protein